MTRTVFVSLIALTSTAAIAQTAPTTPTAAPAAAAAPTVGATVTGKDSQPAGTIVQVNAQAVVIDTGTNKVPVPPSAIGTSPKGPTIGMTKGELDAAYAKAAQQAAANINLSPGTMVHDLNGAMLGTIKVADAQNVTVKTPKGDVQLPRSGFAPGENNTVRVGVTQADLNAALASAPGAAGAAGTATTTDSTSTTTTTAPATGESSTTTETSTTTTATDPAADPAAATKTTVKKTKKTKKPSAK